MANMTDNMEKTLQLPVNQCTDMLVMKSQMLQILRSPFMMLYSIVCETAILIAKM